jgi:hypothetical protein
VIGRDPQTAVELVTIEAAGLTSVTIGHRAMGRIDDVLDI